MIHTTAILLAAGKGARLRSKISKPLVRIDSKPVMAYSLETLNAHPGISDIVVAVNPGNREAAIRAIKKCRVGKLRAVVNGGRRRQDSVAKALKAISPEADIVLVHDAARPFIDKDTVSLLIRSAARYGAAIPGVPLKSTVKVVDAKRRVKKTLDRGSIWEVQTPQAFKRALILEAYKRFGDKDATDDAALVERLGSKVIVVKGSYSNIKITTPQDLVLARVFAGRK